MISFKIAAITAIFQLWLLSRVHGSISSRTGLNGISLKIAIFHIPPFDVVKMQPDGNFTYTGSNRALFTWLAQRMNFNIHFVLINESAIAKHGSAIDLDISLIVKNEVDTSTIGMIFTPERMQKMDNAYFTWTEPQAMVVPRPVNEEPRLFAFIKPFRPDVWLLILIVMIVMVFLMSLFSKIFLWKLKMFFLEDEQTRFHKMTTLQYISGYFVYIINVLTNQGKGGGDPTTASRLSFRVLVGTWLLMATVIVNSYGSTVISYLTVTKMQSPINSFQDLADQHEIELALWKDTVIASYILDSQTGVLKILGDRVRKNPKNIISGVEGVGDVLRTGRFVFPFLKSFCDTFVVKEFQKDGKCRFATSDPLPLTRFWALALPKGSKYTSHFTFSLMEAWEVGLPFRMVKMYTPQAPQCFTKIQAQANSSRQVPIRLGDLSGAFLFLGIGCIVSLLVFAVEILYGHCRGKRQFNKIM